MLWDQYENAVNTHPFACAATLWYVSKAFRGMDMQRL